MAYTTINKGSSYFNTILYTGNGTARSITGVGFKPDFTWIKSRSDADSHYLVNNVAGYTKYLLSNSSQAEVTDSNIVTSSDSDGFTIGTSGAVNGNTATYVVWNWLANNTSGSSNTSGTITSTVAANTTAGFSIVSYSGNGTSGATVGHGLGSALGLIILKCRSTAGTSWQMFHKSLGATKSINLEDTAAAATSTAYWNDTAPTSSVFTLGNGGDFNNGSRTYIAYCFSEIKGYSKFGSYTGNNSTDGVFVYTGFKPAFIIIKATNSATQFWTLMDNKRNSFNMVNLGIGPNSSNSESTFNTNRGNPNMDFVSNGFKFRTDNSGINGTLNYIYMAFAENPFVSSTLIPTTAR
jgi:hypothetical protein